MDSANCNYDFDNVTLQRNYVNNSSFEDSTQYWAQRFPGNCQSYWAVYASSVPYQDNNYFLQINRGTCGAYDTNVSFYQDVAAYTQPGERYYMRVRVRRHSDAVGTINLHLWALWVPNSSIIDQWVDVPADGAWHEYEYSNTVPNPGNWIMRAEVYLYSADNFDFDGFQIWGGAGN
jgi:hypothetical protein